MNTGTFGLLFSLHLFFGYSSFFFRYNWPHKFLIYFHLFLSKLSVSTKKLIAFNINMSFNFRKLFITRQLLVNLLKYY